MQIREITKEQHDTFLKQSYDKINLLQSSDWANIKENWGNICIGFYNKDKLVGSALVLTKPIKWGLSMWYIPRGPIMSDRETFDSDTLKELRKFGRKHKAILIKFDPFLTTFKPMDRIKKLPLFVRQSGFVKDMKETIQPQVNAIVEKRLFPDEYTALPKKTKQAIRTAKNQYVTIRHGKEELLDVFVELLNKTADHKDLIFRNSKYFHNIMKYYPNSYITLSEIDVDKRLSDKNIKEEERLLLENHKGRKIPLAATLTVISNNTAELLYAGMDYKYRKYNAPVLTWVEAINKALYEENSNWVNLGGVENKLEGKLFFFKKKFNPLFKVFIGEFDILTYPIISLLAYYGFKWLKRKKKDKKE